MRKGQACVSRPFPLEVCFDFHLMFPCSDSDSMPGDPHPRPLAPLWRREAPDVGLEGGARGQRSRSSHHGSLLRAALGGAQDPVHLTKS